MKRIVLIGLVLLIAVAAVVLFSLRAASPDVEVASQEAAVQAAEAAPEGAEAVPRADEAAPENAEAAPQNVGGQPAEIQFERTDYDFGTFSTSVSPVMTAVFPFTNVGGAPLVINDVETSCGCTQVDYPRQLILSGMTGTVRVSYDSRGRMLGRFKKGVTIRTNGKTPETRLHVLGTVRE